VSVWDKKFKELLEASEENQALKAQVATLEDQISRIAQAVSGVQRTAIDLTKICVDNRRGLEEVFTYLTAADIEDHDPMQNEDGELPSPEELADRKRMMN